MHLPAPFYDAVPAIYIAMGIATWFFAAEAVVLEKGMGYVAHLSLSALLLIGYGFHRMRQRRRIQAAGKTQS